MIGRNGTKRSKQLPRGKRKILESTRKDDKLEIP